ncbi:MAG: hypothetical protein ACD_62C00472G0001 [uncultured bacterium]|nr:MAG: hypothetical protein ACD_62C00472G0001 [uncultured bacterium]
MRNVCYMIFFLFFYSFAVQARVTEPVASGPFYVRSQNPLYLKFLAMPMEPASTLAPGVWQNTLSTTFSNVFEYDPVGDTVLNLDMEIWRTAYSFAYGVSKVFDVRVDIAFVSNMGGFLDSFIQGYHDAFGFPNGGRDLVPNNEYHFELTQNGNALVDYSQETFGLSDVVLRGKYFLSKHISLPIDLATAFYFKLPVGRSGKGLSSGQADAGLSLFGQKSFKRFHLVSQLGVVVMGEDALLAPLQKRAQFVFGQSVEYQILDGWSVLAQLSGNTAAFDRVDTTDLSDPVMDLTLGFAGTFLPKKGRVGELFYQWSFSEDVLSRGPSVDFSMLFLVGVRY